MHAALMFPGGCSNANYVRHFSPHYSAVCAREPGCMGWGAFSQPLVLLVSALARNVSAYPQGVVQAHVCRYLE